MWGTVGLASTPRSASQGLSCSKYTYEKLTNKCLWNTDLGEMTGIFYNPIAISKASGINISSLKPIVSEFCEPGWFRSKGWVLAIECE